jgi:adenosylcobinamide-GDP ribazoletransferase
VTASVRLAFGTLTAARTVPPAGMDRRTAGIAMALAPVVGLLLGAVAELAVLVVRWSVGGWADRAVAAVAGVAVLAVLSSGALWVGLANTADALAGGASGAAGLEVMRRPAIQPVGVLTVVLVLLTEVTALAAAILDGRGTLALVGGAIVARLAMTWTARTGVPEAGAAVPAVVAGSVSWPMLLLTTLGVGAALGGLTIVDDDLTRAFVPQTLLAALAAVAVAQALVMRAVRRFGGVTLDVMAAAGEVAFCVFVLGVVIG